MAQATALENISPERTLSGLSAQGPVLSPSCITLENNEKIRPQRTSEKLSFRASGGQRGIRTLETVPRLHTFQACAFDHSATCPWGTVYKGQAGARKGGCENCWARPNHLTIQVP